MEYIIFAALTIAPFSILLYFIVKLAVRNGILEADALLSGRKKKEPKLTENIDD